jgi:hypothetical protein
MTTAVQLVTGQVTTHGNGSLSIWGFYRKTMKDRELPLQDAERTPDCNVNSIAVPTVTRSCHPRFNQNWVQRRADYPDKSLVRMQFKLTYGSGTLVRFEQAGLLLRPRAGAALRQIEIDCPTDDHTPNRFQYLIGRFDVLPMDEIMELYLKHPVPKNEKINISDFNLDNIDFITVRMVEREVAPPQKAARIVVQKPGGKKVEKLVHVRRRLRI